MAGRQIQRCEGLRPAIVVFITITPWLDLCRALGEGNRAERTFQGILYPRGGNQVPGLELVKVGMSASSVLLLPAHVDTPNIVVPLEVVAGTEVEVSCLVPDNCPELRPELSWLGHDGLGEPAVLGRLREDEGTWVQMSLLHFVPTREANGLRLGCQASFPNTTLQFEGYASLDVKCEPGCHPGAGVGPVAPAC